MVMQFIRSVLVAAFLAAPVIYLTLNWRAFPQTIPTHFGASGLPDGWGPQWTLVLLPGISVLIVSLLTFAKRFPHLFNYPVRITDSNYDRQRILATGLLDQLQVVVAAMLGYISIQQMRTALKLASGLGVWFFAVTLVGMFGTISVYFVRAVKGR